MKKISLCVVIVLVFSAMLLAQESEPSAIVGYVAYECVTGTTANNNFIAVPLEMVDTEGETLELLNDLGNYFRPTPEAAPLVTAVSFWVPETQSWGGIAWDGDDQVWQGNPATPFPLNYGHAYMINVVEELTFYNVGNLIDPIQYNLVEGTTANNNFIMVPLNRADLTTLIAVGNDIGVADVVSYWVPGVQGWDGISYDGQVWQGDLELPATIGMPLMVNVTDETAWPGDGRRMEVPRRRLSESRRMR